MLNHNFSLAVLMSGLGFVAGCTPGPSVSFKTDVQPLLNKYCAECHTVTAQGEEGKGLHKSGFNITNYALLMKGTKFGPVVVPGSAASSSLYRLISGKVDKTIQMPHGKESLPLAAVSVIETWIDQGAPNN